MEQVLDKGKSAVSTAVNGIANFAKSNAHVLWIVGVFLLLLLLVMSAFSSCSILFSGTTQVSGQTIYTAEDRDIKGAETDYKKLEKDLDKKIKRTPQDHPGYDEYQYHLDTIEHDPWRFFYELIFELLQEHYFLLGLSSHSIAEFLHLSHCQ